LPYCYKNQEQFASLYSAISFSICLLRLAAPISFLFRDKSMLNGSQSAGGKKLGANE
jgi:hypothetical protein